MELMQRVMVLAALFLVAGCAATVDDYADKTPKLELPTFFSGELVAHGMVQDRSDNVLRHFSASIRGEWQGNQGILDEQFIFDDGEEQHRCWRLTKEGDSYTGTAGDVIGTAAGRTVGNALNWQYQLLVPVDGTEWTLNINDWMYLIDENNLLNRATMSKFGLEVGQITLSIRKVGETGGPRTPGCSL